MPSRDEYELSATDKSSTSNLNDNLPRPRCVVDARRGCGFVGECECNSPRPLFPALTNAALTKNPARPTVNSRRELSASAAQRDAMPHRWRSANHA
jgi:hypothetical protein